MNLLSESDKETVCGVVCGHFGIPHVELIGSLRTDRIATARWVVFYLLYRLTGANKATIGAAFGMKNGTVRYGIIGLCDAMSVDKKLASTVNFLEERCKLLLEAKV